MKTIIAILVALLFLSACAVDEVQTTKTPEKIVFGGIAPLSGDCAEYGTAAYDGIMIALEEINAKGGINGKQVEIIFEDDKCNAKDTTTAVQKLITVDGVKVIFGGASSSETIAAAPIADPAKVILISPMSSSPDITNSGDFVFRTVPSDSYAAKIAGDFAFKRWKKVAVISELKDYSQGQRNVFKDNFVELGGEIVADEVYGPDDTDFRTQILKIKTGNPDVIVVYPQSDVKGLAVVKQLRESGLNQQLLGSEILIAKSTVEKAPDLLEGFIGVEPGIGDVTPKAAALFAKYKEKKGKEPPLAPYMASAYDDVYLISDAISAVGLDTEKIRDWLYNVKDYDGAIGKINFDKNGDPLLKFVTKQVKDGKAVEVSK